MSDPRFEVENERLKAVMRELAGKIDAALKAAEAEGAPKVGFGLFLFEFAPGNAMFWISNGDRRDTSKMLREWLKREGWQ